MTLPDSSDYFDWPFSNRLPFYLLLRRYPHLYDSVCCFTFELLVLIHHTHDLFPLMNNRRIWSEEYFINGPALRACSLSYIAAVLQEHTPIIAANIHRTPFRLCMCKWGIINQPVN
jgi:hypothetical protein